MKYTVIASLEAATLSARDGLFTSIETRLAGKPAKSDSSKGNDLKSGKPNCSLSVRFDNEADMADLFGFIKGKMVSGVTGKVTHHNCYHGEKETPCIIDEEYEV